MMKHVALFASLLLATGSLTVYAAGSKAAPVIVVDAPTVNFTWAHIGDENERVIVRANGTDDDCEQPGQINWDLTYWHADGGELTDSFGRDAEWKATDEVGAIVKCKLDDSYSDADYNDDQSGWSPTVTLKGFYVGAKMDVTKPDDTTTSVTLWEVAQADCAIVSNNSFIIEWLESEDPIGASAKIGTVNNSGIWTYLTYPVIPAQEGNIQGHIQATLGHGYEGGVDIYAVRQDLGPPGGSKSSATIGLDPLKITREVEAKGVCDLAAAVAAGFQGDNYLGDCTNCVIQNVKDDRSSSVLAPDMNPKTVSPSCKPGLVEKGEWKIEAEFEILEVDQLVDDAFGWAKSTIVDTWSLHVPEYVRP